MSDQQASQYQSWQRQEELGNLLRLTDDVTYQLRLALFKFFSVAQYFDEIPVQHFDELETAIKQAEDTLAKIRAAMATYVHGEVRDAEGNVLF